MESNKTKHYGSNCLYLMYKIAREGQARYEAGNLFGGDLASSMEAAQRDEAEFFEILKDLTNKEDKIYGRL
jgi:hypothetical protein